MLAQVQSFLVHFWQGMPPHIQPILSSDVIVSLIGVCDSILYKAILDVLMPSILQPLPDRFLPSAPLLICRHVDTLTLTELVRYNHPSGPRRGKSVENTIFPLPHFLPPQIQGQLVRLRQCERAVSHVARDMH